MDDVSQEQIIFMIVGGLIFGTFGILWFIRRISAKPIEEPEVEEPQKKQSVKQTPKKSKSLSNKPKKQKTEKHELCFLDINNSKQRIGGVAFDPKDLYLVTTGDDRQIRLYAMDTLFLNDRKLYKINIEADFPSKCCFSQEGHYLVVALHDTKELHAYKLLKKKSEETGKVYELARKFPNKHPKGNITNIQLSGNSQYLLTCSDDTIVNLWNLKGEIMATINTKQMKNYMACISPDSQLIAAATFMSGVNIWRFNRSKEGVFLGVEETHFTQLRGHEGSVFWVTFTSDSKKVITSGKDGTWKFWDIDVDYKREEQPKIILSGNHPKKGESYNMLAVARDTSVLAAISGRNLHFWNLKNGNLIAAVDNAHAGSITDVSWNKDDKCLATSSTDGSIRLFHNPTKK